MPQAESSLLQDWPLHRHTSDASRKPQWSPVRLVNLLDQRSLCSPGVWLICQSSSQKSGKHVCPFIKGMRKAQTDKMHKVRYVGKGVEPLCPVQAPDPQNLLCPPTPKPSKPRTFGILRSLHHEGMINYYLYFQSLSLPKRMRGD